MERHPTTEARSVKSGGFSLGGWGGVKARFGLLIALGMVLAPTGVSAEVEVFKPSHRSASELAQLAEPLLEPGGTAIADPQTGTLLLRGESADLARVLTVLRYLDTAPAQYRIEVEVVGRERLREFDVSWARSGELKVGRLTRLPGSISELRIDARSYGTRDAERLSSELVVMEGRTGELWTGTDYPARVRLFDLGSGRDRVLETAPLVPVRSGFRVRPQGLSGGWIQLEITPVLSERGPHGEINQTSASTSVRIKPGEQIVLGSVQSEADSQHTGLVGAGRNGSSGEKLILLRAQLLESSSENPVAGP